MRDYINGNVIISQQPYNSLDTKSNDSSQSGTVNLALRARTLGNSTCIRKAGDKFEKYISDPPQNVSNFFLQLRIYYNCAFLVICHRAISIDVD